MNTAFANLTERTSESTSHNVTRTDPHDASAFRGGRKLQQGFDPTRLGEVPIEGFAGSHDSCGSLSVQVVPAAKSDSLVTPNEQSARRHNAEAMGSRTR